MHESLASIGTGATGTAANAAESTRNNESNRPSTGAAVVTAATARPGTSRPNKAERPTMQSRKAWYQYLTIDLLILVLSRSIFHPAITLIFYLCLASVHKHRTPMAAYTLYWAAFLVLVEVISYVNYRITYGWPRKVNWEDEVVVITGGGGGLGRVLAEMLMISKGVRVAVLDVREPDEEALEWIEGRGGFLWEVCDVANSEDVQKAAVRINEELGTPTILINNAAAAVNGLPLIPAAISNQKTISPAQAARTLNINAISHFNTLSAFLPSLLSSKTGAHIVTISSILSHLSPTRLSDYATSKAAVSALHHSLCHELAVHPEPSVRKTFKTILVEPGQMDTQLFADITSVPWYANFLGPVLEAKDVAREILRTLESGEGAVMRLPFYSTCMPYYGILPGTLQRLLRWFAGIDVAIVADLGKQE